nr:hypothetical protein BaRGS_024360 [Batillaria attramentaria]
MVGQWALMVGQWALMVGQWALMVGQKVDLPCLWEDQRLMLGAAAFTVAGELLPLTLVCEVTIILGGGGTDCDVDMGGLGIGPP